MKFNTPPSIVVNLKLRTESIPPRGKISKENNLREFVRNGGFCISSVSFLTRDRNNFKISYINICKYHPSLTVNLTTYSKKKHISLLFLELANSIQKRNTMQKYAAYIISNIILKLYANSTRLRKDKRLYANLHLVAALSCN